MSGVRLTAEPLPVETTTAGSEARCAAESRSNKQTNRRASWTGQSCEGTIRVAADGEELLERGAVDAPINAASGCMQVLPHSASVHVPTTLPRACLGPTTAFPGPIAGPLSTCDERTVVRHARVWPR